MHPHVITLKNGLPVILIDTKAFPTVSTLLLVGAGSRFENTKNNGIAHFFEHMAFKGSKKYPSSFIISSTIEQLGGVFNAFTGKDHTGYWIKGLRDDFEVIIDVLADMVLHPLLVEEEINREKGVIVEEINMYEDTPYRRVSELFETLLYGGTPLGFDITGSKKTVSTFTRKTFTSYIEKFYHPANAVLIVAGGLETGTKDNLQRTISLIERGFATWQKRKTPKSRKVVDHQLAPELMVKYKKTEQAHLCLGFRAFSYFDERKYALSVLATILGGGMSSRLFMEVRERRGLCYYVSTGRELYHDVGNIVTQAGVTNNIEKVKEAVSVILKEHQKISQGVIEKTELEKAKEILKGRLYLSMEDSINVASFYGVKKLLESKVDSPEEVVKKIESVDTASVVTLAQELFQPKKLNFAIIGPFQKDQFKDVIAL